MTRRFVVVTVCLTATIAFLIGLIVAGSMTPQPAISAPTAPAFSVRTRAAATLAPVISSFADVAERLNPAVVNIDATTRGSARSRRFGGLPVPDGPELFDRPGGRDPQGPRRGAGTGFVIDPAGLILTNHHVVDGADRIMVRLTDGRNLHATRIGSDPDTDVALIKVDSTRPLPYASLGDSDALRVGEWVVAIGNPLAYEHTVTVGVVSFIGRKLFDSSLDRYIQTDAAINFGNSGGPLINARGEVIGINAAISSRAANIGFAVPINQARAILPQLREKGHVSRGYIGVSLRDVDPDLQRSLGLATNDGALVQDVTSGSPGARAGIRAYDLIVAVDGKPVSGNDQLIEMIATRQPGTVASLQILRENHPINIPVKLAERPQRDRRPAGTDDQVPQPSSARGSGLGLSVRDLDRDFADRFKLPDGMQGVVISRVEPMSPAFDAEVERGHVLLEINRHPVRSVDDYRRLTATAKAGDILTLYVYKPENDTRALLTVKIE
ncbi:MAG TPA: trypsin-like peptidase domain-containing protein [Vicinamibacterales bacterium]|nr:trypsin-like peptidase domain-containing protein [Vicinamibacterales bacterium]